MSPVFEVLAPDGAHGPDQFAGVIEQVQIHYDSLRAAGGARRLEFRLGPKRPCT